jgi:chorismate mutase
MAFSELEKQELRDEVFGIDEEIIALLAERRERTGKLGLGKHEIGEPIEQPEQFARVQDHVRGFGETLGLEPEYLDPIWDKIHEGSVNHQYRVIAEAHAPTAEVPVVPQPSVNGTL